jgi:hypothetical protein
MQTASSALPVALGTTAQLNPVAQLSREVQGGGLRGAQILVFTLVPDVEATPTWRHSYPATGQSPFVAQGSEQTRPKRPS